LPCGSVGPQAKWAATSNVEAGQTTYCLNKGEVRTEGEKGQRDKITERGEGRREYNKGEDHSPLATKGG